MPELHDLLEREAETYAPPPDLWDRVRERGRRRERTRRAASGLAAVLVIALAAGGLLRALTPTDPVQFDHTRHPFEDTWVSRDWYPSRTMEIRAVDRDTFGVAITEDSGGVCVSARAIMTGTGQLEGAQLVIPALVLECDDGTTTPGSSQLRELDEMLRNYSIVYDAATDALTDDLEVQWVRRSASPEEAQAGQGTGLWPQSNTDQVRKAQRRADAGDPRYTWQVDAGLDADRAPGDAEIFSRFLTQKLGWQSFRRSGAAGDPTSVSEHTSVVAFVRCAAGQSNPLYAHSPDGRNCAPTQDEFSYETVSLTAYQPFDAGASGIWVIVSMHADQSVRQTVPPSDAEIADVLEDFGQARVDGRGAEDHLMDEVPENEIPLLYATRTGARYERFDFEVVSPPRWPDGTTEVNLRLFADSGKTVVEQRFWLGRVPSQWVLWHDRSTPGLATTTENGVPAPEPYSLTLFRDAVQQQFEDGVVTFSIDPSWENLSMSEDFSGLAGHAVMEFSRPGAHIAVVADPLPPAELCAVGEQAESAAVLIRRLRSSRSLSVTKPVAAALGGMDAVRLDVTAADRGTCSEPPLLAPRGFEGPPTPLGLGPDEQARVYVFQTPGDPGHTVAVVVIAAAARFEQASATARPIIQSFDFAAS